jgi:hypothetical protein
VFKRRSVGVAILAAGLALIAGLVAVTNAGPWLERRTSDTDPSAAPSASGALPAGVPLLPCGDSDTKLRSYPNRGITLPGFKLPATEEHPKLDFSTSDIPLLRARATGGAPDPHGIYQRDWKEILDDVSTGDVDGESDDDVNSRKAKAYGFAYVITGQVAYRDVAVSALSAAFQSFDSDDAYIAAQVTNYAQAYDYVAGSLERGGGQDTAARAAVKRGAQWLVDWLHHDNPRPHNHRSKVALALGLWSLVFSSDESANAWLPLAVDQLNSVYRYMFTRDGVYLDGYGYYWVYQLFQVIPFLYAARNIAGKDLFPAMQPVFEWMVRDSSPQGWLMNIDDSWVKTVWTAVVAGPYLGARTGLSRTAALGNILQWRFFNQDWKAPRYPKSWTGATNQAYTWPDEIAHIDQGIAEVAPDSDGFDFYAHGGNSTVMRSDWKYNDPATRWLMFYGAPQSNNHEHCDTMQVLLNAENTVLLNDNGYGPQRFAKRKAWYPADRHNVITMDGTAVRQVYQNTVNLDGGIAGYSEKLAYYDQQVVGTAGTRSWRRGVLFAARDYAVIADTMQSPDEQTWDSYLHARGTLTREGPVAVWTTPANVFGASAKLYALTLPGGAPTEEKDGLANLFGAGKEPPDTEPNTYLQSTQRGTGSQFLTIAVPRSLTAAAPAFADLSKGPVLAATVGYDGHTDTVLKQSRPGTQTAGELTSDGRLAWTRKTGDALRGWQLVDGTELTYAGVKQVTASTSLAATADLTGGKPVVDVQVETDAPYTLTVHGDYPVATFDGGPVDGAPAGDSTRFQLTGSGRLVLDGIPATATPRRNQ